MDQIEGPRCGYQRENLRGTEIKIDSAKYEFFHILFRLLGSKVEFFRRNFFLPREPENISLRLKKEDHA